MRKPYFLILLVFSVFTFQSYSQTDMISKSDLGALEADTFSRNAPVERDPIYGPFEADTTYLSHLNNYTL